MRTLLKVLIGLGVVSGGTLLIGSASHGAVSTASTPMLMSAEEFARVHRLAATPNTVNGTLIVILILALLLPIVLVALRRMPRTSRSPILVVSAIGVLLFVVALGAANQSAMAFGSYGSLVPNFGASIATNPNGTHCNLCHAEGNNPAASTPFKTAFANANHLWTVALAQTDSDGDGFSNGEELQDPNGATVGTTAAADPYGDTAFLSSPALTTATFVNDTSGFGTRGYPVPPIITTMSLADGQTIAGSLVVSASIRYAGLSKEVWTVTNSGGAVVYSSTIAYVPLTGTDYQHQHCLGANAPTMTCTAWNSAVLPNGSYTVSVTAYDRLVASLGGPQTNSLSRSVTINNVAAADADVSISKTASSASVLVGSPLTYTLVVANAGPLTATNVMVTDTLPASVTFTSVSSTAGICTGTSTVVCSISSLANGSSATVTLVVAAAQTGTVNNTAQVSADQSDSNLANNQSTATVVVGNQVPSDLSQSRKVASEDTVRPNDTVRYTIQLVNSGTAIATVNVTDPVPALMQYVNGSATGNGTYDPASRTLSWTGVMVLAGHEVPLSFMAKASNVASQTLVINVATINDGTTSFDRQAPVVIAPAGTPMPHPMLGGSRKMASKRRVSNGEVLTYTIKLRNSGTADASVDVVDPIPDAFSYMPGTASNGGQYDPGAKTLTWSGITVPMHSRIKLTFAVTPTLVVTRPMVIVNTATIKVAGNFTFTRSARVRLIPHSDEDNEDEDDPEVSTSTIGTQDVLTNRAVTLHIAATDNVGVKSMYLLEWELVTGPSPHWAVSQSSGWVPYQPSYAWTLNNTSGAHYVSVWVADAAGGVSPLDSSSIDFASLVLPNATVPQRGVVPYLVYYPAGVNVRATLSTLQGDADLYVWYPDNFFMPDQQSTNSSTAADAVNFTTPRAGIYLFIVHGYAASTYNLNITPAGGPQVGATPSTLARVTHAALSGPLSTDGTKPDGLLLEPVLSQSGVDPLPDAVDPSGPNGVYLPLVIR